ncbi:mitochondrial carrier domain-containing protein [Zopfochytrium polystomum]|nr:mitochondrial carrier domain-containing protein [Zopfochytrium polystomum]
MATSTAQMAQARSATASTASLPALKASPGTRWWFGGVAAMAAAAVSHPLDTLKIRMQTSTTKSSVLSKLVAVIRNEGISALYAGLSASLLRQALYSTARFSVNDAVKVKLGVDQNGQTSIIKRLTAAVLGGLAGGILGTPADVANVRMQDDGRLPPAQRRGYKNAVDGLVRIGREEGLVALFRGWVPNTTRAAFMTAAQIVSYDTFKIKLLTTGLFKDNIYTHFTASCLAGLVATTVTSPFDVLKTRLMVVPKGTYSGSLDAAVKIFNSEGPLAFYKGWVPAFTRHGPHTVLTFVAYEKLKSLYASNHTA